MTLWNRAQASAAHVVSALDRIDPTELVAAVAALARHGQTPTV